MVVQQFSLSMRQKKNNLLGKADRPADRQPTSTFILRIPAHDENSVTSQKGLWNCFVLLHHQHGSTFTADDGALALDYETGQWWLLQGKPDRVDGLLCEERIVRD